MVEPPLHAARIEPAEASETFVFMSDPWLSSVRELFEQLAPSTREALGSSALTIAELFPQAPTPSGEDGWYVTIGDGRVQRFGRGSPPTVADIVNELPFADAAVLAADPEAVPGDGFESRVRPGADLQALTNVAPVFEGLHLAIARRTSPPTG